MKHIHECTLPDDVYNKLKEAVLNCENNENYNHHLAGNIRLEKDISKYINDVAPFLISEICKSTYLTSHINHSVLRRFNTLGKNFPELTCNLETLWVNFQRKHEFNPIHNHAGVLSFVIFMQIPYLIEDQKKIAPGDGSNNNCPGNLAFIWNDFDNPELVNYPIDKTWEKKCLIFPSQLLHCVYPFYGTDLPRITIAGNFYANAKSLNISRTR